MQFAAPVLARQPLPTPAAFDAALAHHGKGRLDEAAGLYQAILDIDPTCAVALNMLGNLESQRNRFDEALRLIAGAIRIAPASPAYRITLGHVHRRKGDLAAASDSYRDALRLSPESTLAAISLAGALKDQGHLVETTAVLGEILGRDPGCLDALDLAGDVWLALDRPDKASHVLGRLVALGVPSPDTFFRLGVGATQQGQHSLAIESFENAISLRPNFPEAHFNLGVIDVERQRLDTAEAWFRSALAIEPEYVDAHVNLSAVLLRAGRTEEARVHREAAYRRKCLFLRTSPAALRTVLILFDAGQGNINLSHLFSRTRNSLIDWMIEFAPPEQSAAVPPFDIVFNGMGDPDMAAAAVLPASRFIAGCNQPVLNRPEAVARTSREKIPALFEGIEGLIVPAVWRLAADDPWLAGIADLLPVLVRPVETHGGTGLQRAASVGDLERIESQRVGPCYVSRFCDFRSADGWYRKYRVIFIDREPFPYHLAISPHWLVHYATAGMEGHAWKLEEERRFLESPEQVLGAAGLAAITAIGSRMNLDYAGVDFSILADGRILVFEANPVMPVHPEDADGVLAFKIPHVQRIFDAFETLLCRVSGKGPSRHAGAAPSASPASEPTSLQIFESIDDALHVRVAMGERAAAALPVHEHGRVGFEHQHPAIRE
ncbi:MAG: tetratricopeptide repeat protein [Pseudomonadota bacterium]|nr:tetratricopeptide repeat protein [Pseudomonadota bacterium]